MLHYAHLTAMPCFPQDFLRGGGTLRQLDERYAIGAKRHPRWDNLVQLKYDQISSPFDAPIVQECRGLILDEYDNWRVIAWPFRKFFNHGEPNAHPIDWHTARVQEKLDGSLLMMYWYNKAWNVATTGMPDAGGMVHGSDITFEDLFWRVWEEKNFPFPPSVQQNYTFLFELTSPLNRVVVSHIASDLHLLGMRSNFSGIESPIRYRPALNPVREFPLSSMDSVLLSFTKMDPLQQEGYVIVDNKFNRLKVKHPGYVALHHLRSGFSARRAVEVVMKGEVDEVIANFPEWTVPLSKVKASFEGLCAILDQTFDEIKGIEPRKAYAEEAKKAIHPPTLFSLKDGHFDTARGALQQVHIDTMLDLLGARNLVLSGAI